VNPAQSAVPGVDVIDLGIDDEMDVIVEIEPVTAIPEMLLERLKIFRMGEVAGCHQLDALLLCCPGDCGDVHIRAGCPGETGMDMEIGNEAHGLF